MEPVGLVLEGGGMRAVYTAGVLEYFLEQDVYFPYIIGVSAGACMAASYMSRQRGRNRVVNVEMVRDPRYLSWRNLWKHGQLFGMDFIFDRIPNELVPFDFQAFMNSPEELVVGTTDCDTGESVYYYKSQPGFELPKALRASSSLPYIAPIVKYGGRRLLDGGIREPLPIRQAECEGYKRNVVILTKDAAYRKSRHRFPWLLKRAYKQYPEFINTMLRRHEIYNETVAYINEQEQRGELFVIRPQQPLQVGRMGRDPMKLDAVYRQGYEDAKRLMPQLKAWLGH